MKQFIHLNLARVILVVFICGSVFFPSPAIPLPPPAPAGDLAGNPLNGPEPSDECTAGVAAGEVTVDGRPLLWKLRNQLDGINDVHYFAAGADHFPGLGPAKYSFLGMGPANDYPGGPARQGLNSQGLAVGWNVLDGEAWPLLDHLSLGYYDKVSQVRDAVNQMSDLMVYNYTIDRGGEAVLWENKPGLDQHWEVNTNAPARDDQWIDVDNADEDDNYATGTDVNLSGWVVRANDPGHFNLDGTDDLENVGRYQAGRDVVGSLIYNHGLGTALSAKNLAASFFRNNTIAIASTVSSMIVQGVLPDEDPRLSTMWTLLGHSEMGIFVPVWINGVEYRGGSSVPRYLDSGDDGISGYTLTMGMYNAGFKPSAVQARTLPFEAHLFDVVNDTLLPDWRSQNWAEIAVTNRIGGEMKRVQEQMDADAYGHMNYLFEHGDTSNYAPTVSIDAISTKNLEAAITMSMSDVDKDDILSYQINYGDGQTGTSDTHSYERDGHYLISITVTDNHGVSQTDWQFVDVVKIIYKSYLPSLLK